jgi:excisionase family DNA binding protein
MKIEKCYTVFEAEDLTGRKASTWRSDILKKKIAVVRIGRSVRIPESEIKRLLAEGYSPAVPAGGK